MALNTQIWLPDFQKNLYPSNTFYAGTKNDSAYVTGRSVIIPNYLDEVTTFEMTTSTGTYPRTLTELSHTEKTYSMFQPAVDPIFVDPVENEEFAYRKIDEIVIQMQEKLMSDVGFRIAWEWTLPNTVTNSFIETTGATTRANRFGTASVKRISFQDLLNLQTMLNNQNVPAEGRRLLVDAYGMQDIQTLALSYNLNSLSEKAFAEGAVMRIAGFDVFVRSEMPSFTVADAKKAIGAANAVGDLSCAIAYHPGFVRYAVGTQDNAGLKLFIGQNDPTIYGYAVSAYTRVGAAPSYAINTNTVKGLVTLKENV